MPADSLPNPDPIAILELLFGALDRKDQAAILELMGADVVMVDEISRRWLRGIAAVAEQIGAVLPLTTGLESKITDLHSQPLGTDAVLVTGWLDQTYTLDGETQSISAPLSACLVAAAEGSEAPRWQVVSLQAIPLS